jgi:hypothetical protein
MGGFRQPGTTGRGSAPAVPKSTGAPPPVSQAAKPVQAQTVESDPPPVGQLDSIRLWTFRGQPVIYEYDKGVRRLQLTYPNKDGRPFYQVGDFVLVGEEVKHTAEDIFPELKDGDDEISFIAIVMLLLGEFEEPKYKIGWKINSISPNGRSGGLVKMQGVIFLDGTPTTLQKTADFGRQDLNDSFFELRTAAQLQATIVPLCKLTAELVEISLTGSLSALKKTAGKKLLKVSARAAMKVGVRKAFNRFLRTLALVSAKCTLAFLSAMAKQAIKDFDAQQKQGKLRAHIGAAAQPPNLKPILEKALIAGADAFASTLVKEALQASIMKLMDKSFLEIFPGERTLSSRIQIYISKEIVKLCTTEAFTIITDGVLSAWKESIDAHGNVDHAKFEKLVTEKLKSNLENAFTGRIKKAGEGFSDEVFKDL